MRTVVVPVATFPVPVPGAGAMVGKTLEKIFVALASLRLTVVLLAMAMALVFAGTLAQIHQGIWAVQKQYFHSIIIWAGPVPLPGGYIIGGLMLLNLLLAHLTHFKCPTSVEFQDEFARTSTGKLQKFKIRAPYWEGRTRQVN